MPEMSGLEVIAALRKIRPELPAVAISGLMEENRRKLGELGRAGRLRTVRGVGYSLKARD